LLKVGAWRHVEEPPSDVFETSFDVGPRRGALRLEAFRPQLDWKAHADETNVAIVGK
jgi:hypothetical protein